MNSIFHPTLQRSLLVVACSLAWIATTGARGDQLITFELDAPTTYPNGFFSVDSPLVNFTDTVGNFMDIANAAPETIGQGLRVFDDSDGSALELNFTVSVNFLSIDIGNDDPFFTNAGDLAVLSAYNGVNPVGQTSVVLNRDDINNQTIQFSGGPFNRAILAYTDPAGMPFTGGGAAFPGLIEVVDNIRFRIPEPTAVALLSLGLLGIGSLGRPGRRG